MKTFIDITLIMNGAFGLLCSIIVFLSIRKNRIVNMYLAFMILTVSIRLILRGFFELTDENEIISYVSKNNIHSLFICLPYLYLKNLLDENPKFKWTDLLHFIIPTIVWVSDRFRLFNYYFSDHSQVIFLWLIISLIFFYVIRSTYLIKSKFNYSHSLGPLDKQQKKLKNWSYLILVTFFLLGIRVVVSLVLSQQDGFVSDQIFFWINSVIWFFIFLGLFTNPDLLNRYYTIIAQEKPILSKSKNYNKHWKLKPICRITNAQDLQLSQKINGQLEVIFRLIDAESSDNKAFIQSEFSIIDLANKLSIPKSHMVYVFKYHSKLTFTELKKKVRVEEAIELMKNNYLKQNTLESLSKEVGFTTYNTFYTSFKEETGMAPNQFLMNL
jgi:AraC-like DNA-binding protein